VSEWQIELLNLRVGCSILQVKWFQFAYLPSFQGLGFIVAPLITSIFPQSKFLTAALVRIVIVDLIFSV
jgi:hypothetical protein